MERRADTFFVQLAGSGGWAGFRLRPGFNRFQIVVPVDVGADVSLRYRFGTVVTDEVLVIDAGSMSPILLAPDADVYVELGGNAQISPVESAKVWVHATEV